MVSMKILIFELKNIKKSLKRLTQRANNTFQKILGKKSANITFQ